MYRFFSSSHISPSHAGISRFYFLQHLAESTDFAVYFAHPIDDRLAEFLQSPSAVECLERGGYGAAVLFTLLL